MPDRRVVITGIGVISPLGCDLLSFWDNLREGKSAVRPLIGFEPGTFRFPNGAQLTGWNPSAYFEEKQLSLLDPSAQYALAAARQAVSDAGMERCSPASAVITGCSAGGQTTQDESFWDVYKKGLSRLSPMTIAKIMSNSAASNIAMEHGIRGPVYSVSTACASASHAIGQAMWMVRSGACDMALTGGTEAPFSFGFLKAWEAMRVVSPDVCRPFSKDRKGLILGEGAAMFVLESFDSARARGASIYAELAGFAMTSDAHHITQPSPAGAAAAMEAALRDGGIPPEACAYVNAHGTGTAANDSTETSAIRSVFGTHAERLPVSSTKSMHGHALGAAGALETAATVLAMRHGWLPPTANFTEVDKDCNLDVVPNTGRRASVESALSNSFAFGGLNAVLAFRHPDAL